MRHLLPILLLLLSLTPAFAQVSATRDTENPNLVTLKNQQLTLVVDLANGAHVISVLYDGFDNEEIVRNVKNDNGGLFKDLWTTQGWPGEFDQRVYEAEILNSGPDQAVVKTWTMSTGVARNQVKEDLKDILLEKTFVLRAGERMLTVQYAFTNQGEKGKRPAFWSQHALDFDGERKNNVYWRPTRHSVDWIGEGKSTSEHGYWYIAPVIDGWNGVTNRKLKRGIMFLMDYNDLQHVYDNVAATTIEWMYDDVAIPAGKTWTTEISMLPAEGFATFAHGDETLLGAFDVQETPAGLRIDHTAASARLPLTDVTLETLVHGARADWTVHAAPVKVDSLGTTPWTPSINVTGMGPLPCVVSVTVTGTDSAGNPVNIKYADYYGGSAGRNLDLATLEPLHEFPAPPKQKQYLKPDTIELQRHTPPRILFVRGLWAGFHGIDEALETMGDVTVADAWMKKSALGETLGGFPASYEELLGYDVVILGNVSGPMLSTVGQEMLADFLKAGGSMLMLSGDRTYGQADFTNSNFTDLLPYTSAPNDYDRLDKSSALKIATSHPVTKDIAVKEKDVVLYAHDLTPKDDAVTAVTLENEAPALILSSADRPRVAVVTPLPFGNASDGRTLYFRGDTWVDLMEHTLTWLLNEK